MARKADKETPQAVERVVALRMQPPMSQEAPPHPAAEEALMVALAVAAHRPPRNSAAAVHPATTAGAATLRLEAMEALRLPLRTPPAVPAHPVHPQAVAMPPAIAVLPHRPQARQNPQVRAR